ITPESPRWLLDNGRYQEAEQVIQKIALSNKKTVPAGAISGGITETDEEEVKVLDLFKHRRLVFRTLIIFYNL
ncbi:solute carrier family 22 member 13, partial [Plakobranchus ocellatus]